MPTLILDKWLTYTSNDILECDFGFVVVTSMDIVLHYSLAYQTCAPFLFHTFFLALEFAACTCKFTN